MEQTATPTATASTPSAPAPSTVNDAAAALAFADSSLATPETPAVDTPAVAATPPAETPVVDPATPKVEDDPRSPYVDRARFDGVNERMKAAEASLKAYEWAKEFQPEEVQSVATWARALKSNPVEAALHLLSTLETDPQHAQALRSHAARMLGAGRKAEPAADPMPEADLQAHDGTLVYSAAQDAKKTEWLERQITKRVLSEFEQRLRPVQEVVHAHQKATAHATVASVVADMRADADFKAHEKDVVAELKADPWLWELADKDPGRALKIAYANVFRTKVVPAREAGLRSKADTEAVAHLQQRAVAAATSPAAASTSTPKNTIGDARAALEYAYAQGG